MPMSFVWERLNSELNPTFQKASDSRRSIYTHCQSRNAPRPRHYASAGRRPKPSCPTPLPRPMVATGMGVSYMRSLGIVTLCVAFVLCFAAAARADCDDAVQSYNSAISDIQSYLRRYTNCLSSSNGSDDCSSEFRRLRSAQSDYESAVSSYQLYCRR